jgi:chromosome segregation ATPase
VSLERKYRDYIKELEAQIEPYETSFRQLQTKYLEAGHDRCLFEQKMNEAEEKAKKLELQLSKKEAELVAIKEMAKQDALSTTASAKPTSPGVTGVDK